MLLTVSEFRERTQTKKCLEALARDLLECSSRSVSTKEQDYWEVSLRKLAAVLASPALSSLHIDFQSRPLHVDLEYRIPGTGRCCDAVLLGRHGKRPAAVVIELKAWNLVGDRPGKMEGFIRRHGRQHQHPSDQVCGYAEYIQACQSAVLKHKARVHGCVLFITKNSAKAYEAPPNEALVKRVPVFTTADRNIYRAFQGYLATRLTESDETFAKEFVRGTYLQDRGVMAQIGRCISEGKIPQFNLLDEQRVAFQHCITAARAAVRSLKREVIIVEGPPGSGKSAVAAKAWATLVASGEFKRHKGNVVLVTTSQSQSSNWSHFIDKASARRLGWGVTRKASSFSPFTNRDIRRLQRRKGLKTLFRSAGDWQKSLERLERRGEPLSPGAESESVLVSLVDEAHALINTEREHGIGFYGFDSRTGPQAYHIIRCSRVSLFFVDPKQSFRARENTTVDDIKDWAAKLNSKVQIVSLNGAQYRCAGSVEYVDWAERLLEDSDEKTNMLRARKWYRNTRRKRVASRVGSMSGRSSRRMQFEVYSNPFDMERDLRRLARDNDVRLASSYSRPWKSRRASDQRKLSPKELDFNEAVRTPGRPTRYWTRRWNFVRGGTDYTGFISRRAGFRMHEDPLSEVGSPVAVRGFDFDYLGILWLDDLQWRKNRWAVDLSHVYETGIKTLVQRARKEGPIAPQGAAGRKVLEKVCQVYRILLTRAIRGILVWIPDEETRRHVERSLGRSG